MLNLVNQEKSVLLLSDNIIASGNRYLMSSALKQSIPVNMAVYKFDHDNNLEQLLILIGELKVAVIGISLFSTRRLEFKYISQRIRKEFPDIFLACGGPDVNSNYLNVIDWIDYVCISDGEVAFPSLCQELLGGYDKRKVRVPNIIYKIGNEIIRNKIAVETNLDKYPFPFFGDERIFLITSNSILHHKDSLSGVYNVYASRGCPFKCTYCANHLFAQNFPEKKYYRVRSVDNIIEEILTIMQSGRELRAIAFHDEQFGINSKWLEDFISKYKSHVDLPFAIQMNPVTFTREKIKKLKDIGLHQMSFGLQSASQRIRKIYNRPENIEEVKIANQILHELRIPHFFDVIVDNPYESIEDLGATLEFLLSLRKPFVAKTFDLVHLPNTQLTEMLLKDKKISPDMIEGNFKYKDDITWRVRERDVTLDIDEKYLVALLQLTGNIVIPNVIIKALSSLRRLTPYLFKKTVARLILSNWYAKNIHLVGLVTVIVTDQGIGVLLEKIIKKTFRNLFRGRN